VLHDRTLHRTRLPAWAFVSEDQNNLTLKSERSASPSPSSPRAGNLSATRQGSPSHRSGTGGGFSDLNVEDEYDQWFVGDDDDEDDDGGKRKLPRSPGAASVSSREAYESVAAASKLAAKAAAVAQPGLMFGFDGNPLTTRQRKKVERYLQVSCRS
jgi:hypothetical protein